MGIDDRNNITIQGQLNSTSYKYGAGVWIYLMMRDVNQTLFCMKIKTDIPNPEANSQRW